jgi:hypothetical protein
MPCCALPRQGDFSAMIGEVVWYVTGRFYLGQGKSLADYGYFLHLAGIDAS